MVKHAEEYSIVKKKLALDYQWIYWHLIYTIGRTNCNLRVQCRLTGIEARVHGRQATNKAISKLVNRAKL